MHGLRAKIDMLKKIITDEIDKNDGYLKEEIIIGLSKELDELVCEYIEAL
jgi:hypothetical protein